MSDQPIVKLDPSIEIRSAGVGANIQFLMYHPVDNSDVMFEIQNGVGTIKDAHVLKLLMNHPLRDAPKGAGGFILIGKDREFNIIYAKAMGDRIVADPLQVAKDKLFKQEDELKKLRAQLKAKVKETVKA